ncbi:hypothetical protein ACOMHN_059794 [Nucella lapillus]
MCVCRLPVPSPRSGLAGRCLPNLTRSVVLCLQAGPAGYLPDKFAAVPLLPPWPCPRPCPLPPTPALSGTARQSGEQTAVSVGPMQGPGGLERSRGPGHRYEEASRGMFARSLSLICGSRVGTYWGLAWSRTRLATKYMFILWFCSLSKQLCRILAP